MNFFPFNLEPIGFVFFYIALIFFGYYVASLWIARREGIAGAGAAALTDPYAIAALRSGPDEAIRVAIVSLVDRGLLSASDAGLRTSISRGVGAEVPIERAILAFFDRAGAHVGGLSSDTQTVAATAQLKTALVEQGLLPGGAARARRLAPVIAVIVFLIVGALIRVIFIFPPLALLAWLTPASVAILLTLYFNKSTSLGRKSLEALQTQWVSSVDHIDALMPGTASSEVATLAAVFGVGVLPAKHFPGVAYAVSGVPGKAAR